MASPDVMSSLLQSLPPRPPTPPKETAPTTDSQTKHILICPAPASRINVQTPPGIYSPVSSQATGSSDSSHRIRKKVGFSAHAEYKDPPVYTDGNARNQHPTPASLPPSSSKPTKSILKVSASPRALHSSSPTPFDPNNSNATLGAMLDSAIQQLAGSDRESRLDAYMVLAEALKTSDNLPDRVALQEKMGLFMQFIQRDLTAKTPAGAIDTSVVNRALILLTTFFHFPAIASTLSNEFAAFLVDHCIRSFEDVSVPKDIVRRLMQVIVVQNFPPRVITSDRVARLVSSLHNIEEHLRGKGIVMARILVYRKLVQQSRQSMIVHSEWLLDLFTEMLSDLKDIRSAAIALGLDVAFSTGRERSLSRKAAEIISPTKEDNANIQYCERLKAMAKERHSSSTSAVPQIWSVVVLILRSPIDSWDEFTPWLHILQACFNSSDPQTKIEANLAWSRLVYLLHTDDRSFPRRIQTLSQPFAMQLKRKGSDKQAEELRKTVIGGICSLFYYAFKPNTNLTLLDGYWDNCVRPLVAQLLSQKNGDHQASASTSASAILAGLFDSVTPRLWKDSHIVENPLVKPEELPAIDVHWVRRNAKRVFQLIEPLLARDFTAISNVGSPVHKLWKALVGTVASAASKEIKVSIDTANFVAHAFNVLQNIWRHGPNTERSSEDVALFLKGISSYLSVMVASLGLLPFTEKLLSTDAHNHFVTVSTPTHRSGKFRGTSKAPVYHLFTILSVLPPGVADDGQFVAFFAAVFSPFFANKNEKGRADLAQDLLSTIPFDTAIPYGSWLLVSKNISARLEAGPSSVQTSSASGGEIPVGLEYRAFVRVLERGLKSVPNLPSQDWRSFLDSVSSHCQQEAGDAGAAIGVIEPLAKLLTEQWSVDDPTGRPILNTMAERTTDLLYHATHPRDRQAVDAAKRKIWGTAISGVRSASYDTFDHLYKLLNVSLNQLYQAVDPLAAEELALPLLQEVGHFLDRSNPHLVAKTLVSLQDGLSLWIKDVQAETRPQPTEIVDAVKCLWDKVAAILVNSEWTRDLQLASLERLLCAAFESKHRRIVNTSVSMWNSAVDQIEELQYPEGLKSALLALKPFVDITLPGLDTSSIESASHEPFFVDSPDDVPSIQVTSTKSSRKSTPRPASSRSRSPSAKLSAAGKQSSRDSTPRPRSAGSVRRANTPRLRHDDSQIQFAAIESSPLEGRHLDSQLLTERQKEVRQRQKENAAMFPNIRSSPSMAHAQAHVKAVPPQLPSQRPLANERSTTPGPEAGFDDFVASTPTPRRGQPLSVPYHDSDPADPPSSPPQPRGNPLLAEIQSRTANSSLMDDWHFSSSPISGSPNPVRQSHVAALPAERELSDERPASSEGDAAHNRDEDEVMVVAEPELPMPTVEDDVIVEDGVPLPRPSGPRQAAKEIPETPRRYPEMSAVPRKETLASVNDKSDNEIYEDAQSSPLSSLPRTSQTANKKNYGKNSLSSARKAPQVPPEPSKDLSFEASEVDEGSMLRLVVELDSGRLDGSVYRQLVESPEWRKPAEEALDCIVVGEGPTETTPSKPTRPSAPHTASFSSLESNAGIESVGSGSGKKRRRRGPSRSRGGSNKKRKHRETELVHNEEPGPACQASPDLSSLKREREGMELRNGRTAKRSKSSFEAASQSSLRDEIIPSGSSMERSSQGPAGPTEVDMRDDGPQDAEDYEVQSQLAKEAEAQNIRKMSEELEIERPGAMQIDDEEVGGKQDEIAGAQGAAPPAEEEGDDEGSSAWQKLMSTLQSGLDVLRTAKLSRDEVYKAEDMFMDMKRELYEAERRGRA